MATSVTQSLFGMTPQSIQAQRDAEMEKQAMQFARLSPMESARMGLFQGINQLGNAIGSALGYEDPEMAQARARQGLLGGLDMSNPQALREAARNTTDPQVKVFLSDRADALEKNQADIARLNALAQGGGRSALGTGPERMATFVANVQARLKAREPVSEEERLRAQNFADVLSKNQFFEQKDGSIVSVPKNDFGRIRELMNQGAMEIPTPLSGTAPTAVAPPAAGGRPAPQVPTAGAASGVIPTPDSAAAAQAKVEGERQAQVIGASDINQIDKAINIIDESGRFAAGLGSVFSFIPETSAGELEALISSIDAGKLINQIQALKATSSTGATGFGSLTEKEGQRLIDRLGSLRQGAKPKTLRANLVEIRDLMQKLQGGTAPLEQPTAPASQGGAQGNNEAIINRVMSDPRNAGKTRAQVEAALRKRGLIK